MPLGTKKERATAKAAAKKAAKAQAAKEAADKEAAGKPPVKTPTLKLGLTTQLMKKDLPKDLVYCGVRRRRPPSVLRWRQ